MDPSTHSSILNFHGHPKEKEAEWGHAAGPRGGPGFGGPGFGVPPYGGFPGFGGFPGAFPQAGFGGFPGAYPQAYPQAAYGGYGGGGYGQDPYAASAAGGAYGGEPPCPPPHTHLFSMIGNGLEDVDLRSDS